MGFNLGSFLALLTRLRLEFFSARKTPSVGSHSIAQSSPPIPYDLSEDFKLSSTTVDHQHERVIHLVMKASGLAKDPEDRDKLRATFHEFGDALREHFSDEEQILANIKHPKLDEHRAEHQNMLGELESIRQRVAGHGGDWTFQDEALSILNFMLGVTVGHMLGSDLDCALALQAVPSSIDS